MNYQKFFNCIVGSGLVLNLTGLHASIPLWSFTALTSTKIDVAENSKATIQYLIQNNSSKSKNLVLLAEPALSQDSSCQLAPRGQVGSSCVLSLTVVGENLSNSGLQTGPYLCEASANGTPNKNQCYGPDVANTLQVTKVSMPILSAPLTFILPRQGLFTENSGTGGEANCQSHGGVWNSTTSPAYCESKTRNLVITNRGSIAADDVTYTISPALPSGTLISPTSCDTILPGESCILTITPGSMPNSPVGQEVVPSVLTLSGSNFSAQTNVAIAVLTYANIYQSGYIFSLNDLVPINQSATGKVVALVNQTPPQPPPTNGIFWSPGASFNLIPGINETSVSPGDACTGKSDGLCNTRQITSYYAGQDPNSYAAGQCIVYQGGGYQDWYLPAICEMGFRGNNAAISGCLLGVEPALQNIESNVVLEYPPIVLDGGYWSSTQFSGNPVANAWGQTFDDNPLFQGPGNGLKSLNIGVRCTRIIS